MVKTRVENFFIAQWFLIAFVFSSFTLNNAPSVSELQNYYTSKANKYLIKHDVLWDYIDINNQGIDIYATPSDKQSKNSEFRLYWDEIKVFNAIVKNFRYEDAFATYKNKKTERFNKAIIENALFVKKGEVPTNMDLPLAGKRIALDPGHVGNDIHMGLIESRFVKMDIGQEKIEFNEGELTYATAYILKDLLEAKGAEVLITRNDCNSTALGISYEEWYKNRKEQDIAQAVHDGKISKELGQWLNTEASATKVFNKFFQNIDWRERSKLINDFQPDLTLIIHYNADEDNKTWSKPTLKNYNVAFVGGGYVKDELLKIEDRFQFLRQLVTNDLENSIELSGTILNSFEASLKVPTITKADETYSVKNFSLPTTSKGVYSRNLALTRYVMGTICYGESLLQDNINECRELNKRDYTYACGKTSSRVKTVADAYFKGILEYYKAQHL